MQTLLFETICFLAIIILCSGIGSTLKRIFSTSATGSLSVSAILGLSAATVVAGASFAVGLPVWLSLAFAGICAAAALFTRQFRRELLSAELLYAVLLFVIYKLSVFQGGSIAFRFHENANLYGMASLLGYMQHTFSAGELLREFYLYTGFTEPLWKKPPLLPDIWSIPDAQLRFASDEAIGSGRVGLTAFLAAISKVVGAQSFFSLASILSIFAAWCFAGLGCAFARLFFDPDDQQSSSARALYKAVMFLLLGCMPIILIHVAEGMYLQLVVQNEILTAVYLYALTIRGEDGHPVKSLYAPVSGGIVVVSLYFIYPDLLPILVGIAIVTAIASAPVSYFVGLGRRSQHIAAAVAFGALPLLILLADARLRGQLTSRLAGAIGGSIHIGIPTYVDMVIGLPNDILQFAASGPLAPSGFRLGNGAQSPVAAAVAIGFLCLALVAITIVSFVRRRAIYGPTLSTFIPVLALSTPAALPIARILLGTAVNDYEYMRLLSLSIAASAPFLLYFAIDGIGRMVAWVVSNLWIRRGIASVIALGAIGYSQLVFGTSASSFLGASLSATADGCPSVPSPARSTLFVSDTPDQLMFYMVLCGPFRYMTDNWAPLVQPSTTPQVVYYLMRNGGQFTARRIGSLILDHQLIGPCDLACIRADSGFTPIATE